MSNLVVAKTGLLFTSLATLAHSKLLKSLSSELQSTYSLDHSTISFPDRSPETQLWLKYYEWQNAKSSKLSLVSVMQVVAEPLNEGHSREWDNNLLVAWSSNRKIFSSSV